MCVSNTIFQNINIPGDELLQLDETASIKNILLKPFFQMTSALT